jgi:hypothetical protein
MEGRRLFDGNGRLTPRGELVYNKTVANLPVWWKTPQTGEIFGNRPPEQANKPAVPAEDPNSLPVTIGPEYHAIMAQTHLTYKPKVVARRSGLLWIVEETDPLLYGKTRVAVVLKRLKDEPAVLKAFKKGLPDVAVDPKKDFYTLEDKMAALETNLRHVDEHTGKKGYWKVDPQAVRSQMTADLAKATAVVYLFRAP